MPFTFAHPVAVLPLGIKKYKYFDCTALIIGSTAPDFEYFIHFRPYQLYGHTLLGQLFYNLPLVLIVSLIFHRILKEPIVTNLPDPYCTYYYYLTKKRWKINSVGGLAKFIYSALIGMFTHLFWDSFTHVGGYFVTKITILSKSIDIMNFKAPIYKILQHESTVIGLVIIFIVLLRIQDKNGKYILKTNKVSKVIFWLSIVVISVVIGFLVLLMNGLTIGSFVVNFISSGFIGATIVSLIYLREIAKQSHDV
ncbi:MAG: DUF4184 domain-containing protein [Firmicutes bacterium HGW-Firmicutes-7]|nr:MAG: DUF4184 domain-containing protein [Firmicutes bacterium HGW-Firmicutes-7]